MVTLARQSEQRPDLIDEMLQFEEDSRFLTLHRDALLERYPEEWVVVFQGNVVAHSSNTKDLLRELRRKNIPPSRVATTFLSRKPKTFIL